MLLNLLTLGAACALGAFLISLRLGDRGRVQRSGALFVAMLGLLLARLYPQLEVIFGAIAIAAALAYAIPAVRHIRSRRDGREDSNDR
ncbi:hypothetical protein [Salinisphaera hydrothermalis]|uniref:Uncharacterized protein n=1 Tax=Salinisphaera hydrothermalis (strain C41B8) TaxID=1304275 RepID=A0A084IKM6_SALHC|nr:hypothetical protein [Salinisphaera hydrothermalis]KEZ77260.1 hypothetical protein C41B8_11085 [Salinisphaera hydrothermalis C41B8]